MNAPSLSRTPVVPTTASHLEDFVARHVPAGERVLVLDPEGAPTAGMLVAHGCEVVAHGQTGDGVPARVAAVVALEGPVTPEVLRAAVAQLDEDGIVILGAANAGHGTVRLATLVGARPPGESRPRLLRRELEELLHGAGLAVLRLVGDAAPIVVPLEVSARLRESAFPLFEDDPDARVGRYVALARPRGALDPSLLAALDALAAESTELRATAAAARDEAVALRREVAERDVRVEALAEESRSAGEREARLRRRLRDAHEMLARRDAELRELEKRIGTALGRLHVDGSEPEPERRRSIALEQAIHERDALIWRQHIRLERARKLTGGRIGRWLRRVFTADLP